MRPGVRWVAFALVVLAGVVIGAVLVTPRLGANSGPPTTTPSSSALSSSLPASQPPSLAPSIHETPQATPRLATCVVQEGSPLILRLDSNGDMGRQWVISIYEDGLLLAPGLDPMSLDPDYWMVGRRLTAEGVEHLRDVVVSSGLFADSASYVPISLPGVEPPGRGASGYSLMTGLGDDEVTVDWISLFGDDDQYYEPSPERGTLDELARHLIGIQDWLPESEWLQRDPCGYEPARYRVFTRAQTAVNITELDISDVPWPLGGRIQDWGEPLGVPPNGELRCGIEPRLGAADVLHKLRAAGATDFSVGELGSAAWFWLRMGDRSRSQVIDVYLRPMLPDERGCVTRDWWPFGV